MCTTKIVTLKIVTALPWENLIFCVVVARSYSFPLFRHYVLLIVSITSKSAIIAASNGRSRTDRGAVMGSLVNQIV